MCSEAWRTAAAGQQRAPDGDDLLQPLRQHEHDPVAAGARSRVDDLLRGALGRLPHLCIGQLKAATVARVTLRHDQCDRIRSDSHVAAERVDDRLVTWVWRAFTVIDFHLLTRAAQARRDGRWHSKFIQGSKGKRR